MWLDCDDVRQRAGPSLSHLGIRSFPPPSAAVAVSAPSVVFAMTFAAVISGGMLKRSQVYS
jgi:hypothetical protein